jgi:4-alpha-glucanotransferase
LSETAWQCRLTLESGEQQTWSCCGTDLPPLDAAEIEGTSYVVKRVPLPGKLATNLPWGYHQLSLEIPGLPPARTLMVSAPTRAYRHFKKDQASAWGVFLPLYALRKHHGLFSSGDFSTLKEFSQWTGSLGGSLVATLPILPAFLDQPCDPSPYSPISRLLWNEFYLDVSRSPELERCPEAQATLASDAFREARDRLRRSPLVDYREEMALKRQVLEQLARSTSDARTEEMDRFLAGRPEVEDYARFRAVMEKRGEVWHRWPQPLRDGDPKINNLARYACSNDIERAHVFINRGGKIFLAHDFAVPWRATKFETASNFGPALKGLFLHIELIQPRRALKGYGSRNDFLAPTPGFSQAQYDSLALVRRA